ncbi:11223_t:CDS:2 [Racocetra persica]|uniref:11223_t:CDS:1 n=1 Tax=Racocetra persica TaxID=160502 RepID=A0ACA9M0J6_9GLOM|nr:11223_t:CDS:2 [Racocetra persica]
MDANKLKAILQQIAINTGINLNSKRKITNHSAYRINIIILKASDVLDEVMIFSEYYSQEAYNEDLESYYSFLSDSYHYINYESDDYEDNDNEIKIQDSGANTTNSNTMLNANSNIISNSSQSKILSIYIIFKLIVY